MGSSTGFSSEAATPTAPHLCARQPNRHTGHENAAYSTAFSRNKARPNATLKQATNPQTSHEIYFMVLVALYCMQAGRSSQDELVHLCTNHGAAVVLETSGCMCSVQYRLDADCWRLKYVAAEHRRRRACP